MNHKIIFKWVETQCGVGLFNDADKLFPQYIEIHHTTHFMINFSLDLIADM